MQLKQLSGNIDNLAKKKNQLTLSRLGDLSTKIQTAKFVMQEEYIITPVISHSPFGLTIPKKHYLGAISKTKLDWNESSKQRRNVPPCSSVIN